VGAPELVPLVESGEIEGAKARDAVARARAALPHDLDAVVLACTHYPLLEAHFARAFGPRVALLDPAVEQAARVERFANERGAGEGSGRTVYVTSADPDHFREQLARLGVSGLELGDVKHVEEE
jgi:glutamate racemase